MSVVQRVVYSNKKGICCMSCGTAVGAAAHVVCEQRCYAQASKADSPLLNDRLLLKNCDRASVCNRVVLWSKACSFSVERHFGGERAYNF